VAFQADAFQADAFQVGGVAPQPESDIDHVEFVLFMVFGPIRQTMPAFTQHLEANVNDDELVLLLI
jgi:hypothetical protein